MDRFIRNDLDDRLAAHGLVLLSTVSARLVLERLGIEPVAVVWIERTSPVRSSATSGTSTGITTRTRPTPGRCTGKLKRMWVNTARGGRAGSFTLTPTRMPRVVVSDCFRTGYFFFFVLPDGLAFAAFNPSGEVALS